jgi:vancomycin aglycone glucosyltransferase
MRILLSTIGSRGDVQPLVALAQELRDLEQDVRLCVPPDFREWIEGLGFRVTPIGPELRSTGKVDPAAAPPTAEQIRQMIAGSVDAQFTTVSDAARGCDLIVGATALQIAAPSVAERMGIPYVFAAYCPVVLPSRHHGPPILRIRGDVPVRVADYTELWKQDKQRWMEPWAPVLNEHRAKLGLPTIDDVRGYVHTSRPWLAADPTLAPWPEPDDDSVFQSGAWVMRDERRLSREIETFLDAGDAPIYFGFGSNRAPNELGRVMIESARAVGRRVTLSRGWADLASIDDATDCLVIDEANFKTLFKRVAAVVHHGGAGTTTAAARAGAPQVVVAQHYDQHYLADRVEQLGIGVSHSPPTPTTGTLTVALRRVLEPRVATRAREIGAQVRDDGALIAARRLVTRDL